MTEPSMTEQVTITINDQQVTVPNGCTVTGALLRQGVDWGRRSVSGDPRGPLCGMGICFECRVTVNGQTQVRGCQLLCQEGMQVRTDG